MVTCLTPYSKGLINLPLFKCSCDKPKLPPHQHAILASAKPWQTQDSATSMKTLCKYPLTQTYPWPSMQTLIPRLIQLKEAKYILQTWHVLFIFNLFIMEKSIRILAASLEIRARNVKDLSLEKAPRTASLFSDRITGVRAFLSLDDIGLREITWVTSPHRLADKHIIGFQFQRAHRTSTPQAPSLPPPSQPQPVADQKHFAIIHKKTLKTPSFSVQPFTVTHTAKRAWLRFPKTQETFPTACLQRWRALPTSCACRIC